METGDAGADLPSTPPGQRVPDAERDHVVTLLREHCSAGRLTLDEFGERLGAVLDARTRGDLEVILADLPSSTYWQWVGNYREALEEPDFAKGLVDEGGTASERATQLARLHLLAAQRFEERATKLAVNAERVDAYERGAYDEPPVNGVMLTVLMTTTLGFSIVVLLRMGAIGSIPLALSLALNAVFLRLWRRPPYGYEAEYRKPWDDAASIARGRAEQARKASIFAGRARC